ncbi:hypothetical protein E0485_17390 [Paenibacillus albiflavus]|uniref:Uncharacterized protein n=1 Tax=Paenibacillus albiflavus TaxID=2545760 RepID=A0A4R4E924_9BACL|nr:hypothetical protein [Paenibacillus albiflavus]TCZ75380.1 hypothetical protein E0485_17390 [Paenibacillus albiflavus]
MKRRSILPKKYQKTHDYIFDLHDLLANIIYSCENYELIGSEIQIKNEEDLSHIDSLEGENLWCWLENNNYDEVIFDMMIKQVYFAVLTDLCHFIYESLTCSERGKLTVAYALLRKPLKDNLLLLEWILSDANDFISKFKSGNSENFAPDKISGQRKLEIIKNAERIADTGLEQYMFIYEMRYSKKDDFSFERIWNKANHIVTTFNFYKTKSENLNFVFFDEKEHTEYWDYYYVSMPLIMYHITEVAISILNNFQVDTSAIVEMEKNERKFKFINYVNSIK